MAVDDYTDAQQLTWAFAALQSDNEGRLPQNIATQIKPLEQSLLLRIRVPTTPARFIKDSLSDRMDRAKSFKPTFFQEVFETLAGRTR